MNYKVRDNAEERGPYTLGQIKAMWSNGTLTSNAECCGENESVWVRLDSMMAESSQEAAPHPREGLCPACKSPIHQDAIKCAHCGAVLASGKLLDKFAEVVKKYQREHPSTHKKRVQFGDAIDAESLADAVKQYAKLQASEKPLVLCNASTFTIDAGLVVTNQGLHYIAQSGNSHIAHTERGFVALTSIVAVLVKKSMLSGITVTVSRCNEGDLVLYQFELKDEHITLLNSFFSELFALPGVTELMGAIRETGVDSRPVSKSNVAKNWMGKGCGCLLAIGVIIVLLCGLLLMN